MSLATKNQLHGPIAKWPFSIHNGKCYGHMSHDKPYYGHMPCGKPRFDQ